MVMGVGSKALSKTYNVAALKGALFVSLLYSGSTGITYNNSLSARNSLITTPIHDVCGSFTDDNKIEKNLNERCYQSEHNQVVINKERIINLEKLSKIALLQYNWNGNYAEQFSDALVSIVRQILTQVNIQPEVFPTACDSIQIEYDGDDNSYLEIEIDESEQWRVYEVSRDGSEKEFFIEATIDQLCKVVDCFYG